LLQYITGKLSSASLCYTYIVANVAYSLGSISDVSLAGAISTGTHGTGKNFSPLSSYVSVQNWLSVCVCLLTRVL